MSDIRALLSKFILRYKLLALVIIYKVYKKLINKIFI